MQSKFDADYTTRVTIHKPRVATLRQVAALPWSGWQPSRGMGGRLQWNTHAIKALAHKLARASYYVMRDQVPFDPAKIYR